ncbi:unnamed protein product [Diabrotica balteata]|uniref:Serine protease K12H4.7 n=1 Tax=Diabrotica balteata TaxID=107213 RepID=A0A9N9XHA7_DIABA|nr:unnamed protein product [Diabrotica balteata]
MKKCVTILKQSIDQVEVLLHTAVGQKHLNELFNLCEDISENVHNSLDMNNFFMQLIGVFAKVVQYNENYRAGPKSTAPDWLCSILLDESIGPEINRLANIYKRVTNTTTNCSSYKYDKEISIIQNRTWESRGYFREFGYYQTHAKFPLSFFVQRCQDIFRSSYNDMFLDHAVNRTNVFYGGLDIEVSNVVFVHGSLDPWRLLGITKTLNEKAPVIIIEGAGHCANMHGPSEYDTPQLTAARVQIGELIEYFEDVEDSLRASNERCSTILKQSIDQVEVHLHTAVGQKRLNKLFNLCEDISENVNNSLDMNNFFIKLIEAFAIVIQYNENYLKITKSPAPDFLCRMLLDESMGPEINRLAFINLFFFGNKCLSYKYDEEISKFKNGSWDNPVALIGNISIIC